MRVSIIFFILFYTTLRSVSAQEVNRLEAEPYYKKAWNYLYNENIDSAEYFFKKCIDIDPNNYWYDLYLAKTATRSGNKEKAINQWILIEHTLKSWYSQEATRFEHMLFEEALVRYLEEDTINAEVLIEKDLRNHPGTRGWQLGQLAYFNLIYNNPKHALDLYNEALSLSSNPNYARNIARAKFEIGLRSEGLEEINLIILSDPKNHINYLYRAKMHIALKNNEKATLDLKASIRIQKTKEGLMLLAEIQKNNDDLVNSCKNWRLAHKLFKSAEAKKAFKSYCK